MKRIYILPGYGSNCFEPEYVELTQALTKKGYEVIGINPNWYKPISEQTFRIEPDSQIIGFSYGSVLAYLITCKYPCKRVILTCLSPIHEFNFELLYNDNLSHSMSHEVATEQANDVLSLKIDKTKILCPFIEIDNEEHILPTKQIVELF